MALRALIELVVLSPDTRDKFTWRFSPDGRYSASSAYRLQFQGSVQTAFVQLIWKPWATPRCRLFAWLLVQNRLMTADRLLARGWPNGYFCPLCMRNLETATHLFTECPFSRQVWAGVASIAAAPPLDPSSWGIHHRSIDWMAGLSEGLPSLEASRVRSWTLLVLWHLWLERNARVFRASPSPVRSLLARISDEAAAWDLAGAKISIARE